MADTLIRELREVAAITPDVRVQRVMREAAKELEARRSSSSVSQGEMPEPVAYVKSEYVGCGIRTGIASWVKGAPPDGAQLFTADAIRAATKAAAPADALSEFASKLTLNQVPLDADMARVYRENAWNMYADDSRAPAEDAREEVPTEAELHDPEYMRAYVREMQAMIAELLAARRASSVPAIPRTGREKEWISVEERLPDLDEPVWLFERGTSPWIGGRGLDGDEWLWCHAQGTEYQRPDGTWSCAVMEADDDYQPTHWMPLPAAPSHPLEAKAGEKNHE